MRHRRCCDVTFARPTLWTVIERFADSRRPGNDSGEWASRNDGGPSLEVGLLAELRAALAEHDIGSELREDLACLAVKTQAPDSCLWVFVSFGGRYFSWNNAGFSIRYATCKARLTALRCRFTLRGGACLGSRTGHEEASAPRTGRIKVHYRATSAGDSR